MMVGHWGSPCPGSGDSAAGWAVLDRQRRCCSRKAAAGPRWALSLHSTGRDGTGPSPPCQRAALTPPSRCSHLQRPRYHPNPAPATGAAFPGPGMGITALQHGRFYSGSPRVSPGLETPAQPSSPKRCPQWGPAARAEWELPGQPERGQVLAASQGSSPVPSRPAPQPGGRRDEGCPAALPATALPLSPPTWACASAPAADSGEAQSGSWAGGWAIRASSCYCISTCGGEGTTGKGKQLLIYCRSAPCRVVDCGVKLPGDGPWQSRHQLMTRGRDHVPRPTHPWLGLPLEPLPAMRAHHHWRRGKSHPPPQAGEAQPATVPRMGPREPGCSGIASQQRCPACALQPGSTGTARRHLRRNGS